MGLSSHNQHSNIFSQAGKQRLQSNFGAGREGPMGSSNTQGSGVTARGQFGSFIAQASQNQYLSDSRRLNLSKDEGAAQYANLVPLNAGTMTESDALGTNTIFKTSVAQAPAASTVATATPQQHETDHFITSYGSKFRNQLEAQQPQPKLISNNNNANKRIQNRLNKGKKHQLMQEALHVMGFSKKPGEKILMSTTGSQAVASTTNDQQTEEMMEMTPDTGRDKKMQRMVIGNSCEPAASILKGQIPSKTQSVFLSANDQATNLQDLKRSTAEGVAHTRAVSLGKPHRLSNKLGSGKLDEATRLESYMQVKHWRHPQQENLAAKKVKKSSHQDSFHKVRMLQNAPFKQAQTSSGTASQRNDSAHGSGGNIAACNPLITSTIDTGLKHGLNQTTLSSENENQQHKYQAMKGSQPKNRHHVGSSGNNTLISVHPLILAPSSNKPRVLPASHKSPAVNRSKPTIEPQQPPHQEKTEISGGTKRMKMLYQEFKERDHQQAGSDVKQQQPRPPPRSPNNLQRTPISGRKKSKKQKLVLNCDLVSGSVNPGVAGVKYEHFVVKPEEAATEDPFKKKESVKHRQLKNMIRYNKLLNNHISSFGSQERQLTNSDNDEADDDEEMFDRDLHQVDPFRLQKRQMQINTSKDSSIDSNLSREEGPAEPPGTEAMVKQLITPAGLAVSSDVVLNDSSTIQNQPSKQHHHQKKQQNESFTPKAFKLQEDEPEKFIPTKEKNSKNKDYLFVKKIDQDSLSQNEKNNFKNEGKQAKAIEQKEAKTCAIFLETAPNAVSSQNQIQKNNVNLVVQSIIKEQINTGGGLNEKITMQPIQTKARLSMEWQRGSEKFSQHQSSSDSSFQQAFEQLIRESLDLKQQLEEILMNRLTPSDPVYSEFVDRIVAKNKERQQKIYQKSMPQIHRKKEDLFDNIKFTQERVVKHIEHEKMRRSSRIYRPFHSDMSRSRFMSNSLREDHPSITSPNFSATAHGSHLNRMQRHFRRHERQRRIHRYLSLNNGVTYHHKSAQQASVMLPELSGGLFRSSFGQLGGRNYGISDSMSQRLHPAVNDSNSSQKVTPIQQENKKVIDLQDATNRVKIGTTAAVDKNSLPDATVISATGAPVPSLSKVGAAIGNQKLQAIYEKLNINDRKAQQFSSFLPLLKQHAMKQQNNFFRSSIDGGTCEQEFNLQHDTEEIESVVEQNKIYGKVIEWQMGKTLGLGTTGEVFEALNINTGETFAVKMIQLMHPYLGLDQQKVKSVKKEIQRYKQLNHKHIVKYYDSEIIENNVLCIYLEYVYKSVAQMCREYGGFGEKNARMYTYQVLQALAYLHKNNFVHGDLKGANVLVSQDGKEIKLCDMGNSLLLKQQQNIDLTASLNSVQSLVCSSPAWMAPETHFNKVGKRSDVWSLGCLIIEMLTGQNPWGQRLDSESNVHMALQRKLADLQRPDIPDSISGDCHSFIDKCLQHDATRRPQVTDLLKHPWIKTKENFILMSPKR